MILVILVILEICIFGNGQEFELIIALSDSSPGDCPSSAKDLSRLDILFNLVKPHPLVQQLHGLVDDHVAAHLAHFVAHLPLHHQRSTDARIAPLGIRPFGENASGDISTFIYLHASNQTHSDSFILG